MDLMNLFKQQLNGDVLKQMTQQSGLNDETKTTEAAQNIFTTLLGSISKNASTEQGAKDLDQALEKDHDGSMMDNIMSLFGGGDTNTTNTKATNGSGILKHVFGGKEETVVKGLSQVNNMNPDATQSMMKTIAPMVMAMLGQAKVQQGVNAANIGQFLNQQKEQAPKNTQLSGIMSMLDKDGDGDVMDDIQGMLGGFFGKK